VSLGLSGTVSARALRRSPVARQIDGGEVTGVAAPAEGTVDDGYTVSISPAIGENGRKRLVGCLEDATLDRVIGPVESITTDTSRG
jgi:hypothetical protein